MKKILLFIILIILPLQMSCEKRLFNFIATIDKNTIYPINQTGAFDEMRTISRQDIVGAVDIPEDARITGVDIEALSLKVVVKEGNQAQSLKVSGAVNEIGESQSFMFNDYTIDLTGIAGVDTSFIGLKDLLATGISKLRSKIEGYILGTDVEDFEVWIKGDSDPSDEQILVDIYFKLSATVKYDQCLDVPAVLNSGEECDIE